MSFSRFIIVFTMFFFAFSSFHCNKHQKSSGDAEEQDPQPDDFLVDDSSMDEERAEDVIADDIPSEEICSEPDAASLCPPLSTCSTIPTDGEIGTPCVVSLWCLHGAECIRESIEFFNGEMYVSNHEGQCIRSGPGVSGCDPSVPITCPAGSKCLHMDSPLGSNYFGCFDACDPVDETEDSLYEYNCGCRVGYQCDFSTSVCVSGCSNDRECCERWWDLNGDFERQDDEVVEKADCTNFCDNGNLYDDDDTTPFPGLCEVSFQCINSGDPENHWGGPCEGDAWCPPDGRCLDEFHYKDPLTGESDYPGGYCIKEGCNYVGRGCSEHGGFCANFGTDDEPYYICIGGLCHFGRTPDDPDYECRRIAGQEQACVPVDPMFWFTPPDDDSDGYCWPGNFPGGTGELGSTCMADEDCVSPYGVGFCSDFRITVTPFCSINCHQRAAQDYAICGDEDESGTAGGVCWSGMCWEACPDPTAYLGENGCSSTDNACYPTALFGLSVYVGSGLSAPEGMCMPRCLDDAWCSDMWGMPMSCDRNTGVCG